MGRKWKPGTVAMVTQLGHSIERLSLRRGSSWACDIGEIRDPYAQIVRPLVVIDPEDIDLVASLWQGFGQGVLFDKDGITAMQDALREFANPAPPKPDEPKGIGAVVLDADGKRWTRWYEDAEPWLGYHISTVHSVRRAWSDIAAVKVLSEGVTA